MDRQFKDCTLDVPSNIAFDELDNSKTIRLTINSPDANMQTDDAAFEGWALLMKCLPKYEKVVVSFDPGPIRWNGDFIDLTKEQLDYMRFLFRLWRFNECMEWFEIDAAAQHIVSGFAEKLNGVNVKANYPKSHSSVSEDKNKLEHHTEKLLVKDEGRYINERLKDNQCKLRVQEPYDQLPNGLFMDSIHNPTRIFPTGYFDLWALSSDAKKLCIFELKVAANTAVGIISELFFYAEYAKFVFLNHNKTPKADKRFHIHRKVDVAYRGYDKLQKALTDNAIEGINAIFLVEKLHSRLAENIDSVLDELNKSKQIEYSVVYYDRTQIPGSIQ